MSDVFRTISHSVVRFVPTLSVVRRLVYTLMPMPHHDHRMAFTALVGAGDACKDTIRYFDTLRSRKAHRYGRDKHLLLDLLPEEMEIRVRSRRSSGGVFSLLQHLLFVPLPILLFALIDACHGPMASTCPSKAVTAETSVWCVFC